MAGKRGTNPESVVGEIRRKTRRKFLAEEKIRIVLEGLRGELSIAELCRGMGSVDVQRVVDQAIARSGVDRATILHRPRLLTANGSCSIAREFREYLADRGIQQVRTKPFHPMTQRKIKRTIGR